MNPIAHAEPTRRPAPRAGGFTLMEMLIVAAVACALAVGMGAALGGRHERRALDLAAGDVVAAVEFAVSQTQMSGLEHCLVLLPGGTGVRVERTDGQAVPGQAGRDHRFAAGVLLVEMQDLGGSRMAMGDRLTFGAEGFVGRLVLQAPSGLQCEIGILESGQAYVP